MLEFRRAVTNARHTVSVADRMQSYFDYDSVAAEELRSRAEADLEEFLETADTHY